MEHTTNRTFISSVVFLDIVEYSQRPVDEQIQLKSRFNGILAEAIKDVAVNDRIILDTGDGAAISFLGDPEDALFVALNIRDAIVVEDRSAKPHLSVCIGINLGPVKLVQDINGQRNLIGDGINVAQRVMSFAIPGQILVSRSYYEVISRLSQEYSKLFHYEGSRADKHVREHQVYSVYPVKKEKGVPPAPSIQAGEEQNPEETTRDDVSTSAADTAAGRQNNKAVIANEGQPFTFQPSSWKPPWAKVLGRWTMKRVNWETLRNNRMTLYIAAAVILILISVPVIVWKAGKTPIQNPQTAPSSTAVALPETAQKTGSSQKVKKIETHAAVKKAETSAKTKKPESPAESEKTEVAIKPQKTEIPTTVSEDQKKAEITTTVEKPLVQGLVSLGIAPWGEVYLDGQKKGVSPPLNKLQMAPGKHTIEIRNTTFPPYNRTVDIKPGEQLKITHKFQ